MTRSMAWGLVSGSRLGRYEIVRGIARGGMGEVYLARMFVGEGDAHKLVAIKRILPHFLDDPTLRDMFFAEGRLALLLDHPVVVQVFDLTEIDGEHIIAMEYIHGRSARDLFKQATAATPIPNEVAVAVVERVARGLHYVHQRRGSDGELLGLVHRDVSPENVMVRFDGGVKLIDFGIARMSAFTLQTRTDVLKGKMGYMSPEQLRQDPIDARSDVFQLGIVAYELTTCTRLFTGDNFAAIMNRVLEAEVPSPSTVIAGYPPALEAIVMRALAFEPEDRFESAGAFAEALAEFARVEGFATDDGVIATDLALRFSEAATSDPLEFVPSEAPTRHDHSPRPRPFTLRGLSAAALVAGLGSLAWSLIGRGDLTRLSSEAAVATQLGRLLGWGIAGAVLVALAGILLAISARGIRSLRAS